MVIPANMLMMQSMHFESFPEVSCDLNADILQFSLSLLKFKINLGFFLAQSFIYL